MKKKLHKLPEEKYKGKLLTAFEVTVELESILEALNYLKIKAYCPSVGTNQCYILVPEEEVKKLPKDEHGYFLPTDMTMVEGYSLYDIHPEELKKIEHGSY